jgi:hypothetical protein
MAHPQFIQKSDNLFECTYEPMYKQKLLHSTIAQQILFGGAQGGSKSTALRWDAYAMAISNPHLNCFLFRRTRDDLLKNHIQFLSREIPSSLGVYRKQDHYLEFVNGSRIYMCYCDSDDDLKNFLGMEFNWLGIDEATTFEAEWLNRLFSRVRMSETEKEGMKDAKRLPRVIYATNPLGGGGHAWLKEKFIDQQPSNQVIFKDKFTALPERYDSEGKFFPAFDGWDSIFIPSRMQDNIHLPENYAAQFNRFSPELRKAYVEGNWDAIIGSALHTLTREKHMLPSIKSFDPRERDPVDLRHCVHFMAMDWGIATPSSIGWYLVTDRWYEFHESKTGRVINVPPDSIIRYAEWYTAEDEYADRGMRLPAEAVARGILKREKNWGLPHMDYRVADYEMWGQKGVGVTSAQAEFAKHGVMLRQSKKGLPEAYNEILSRLAGNPQFNEDGEMKHPAFFVTENCKMWWKLVPGLTLDENNPDKGPDKKRQPVHLYDETVYALMSRPYTITQHERHEQHMDTLREEYLESRGEGLNMGGMGVTDPYWTG